VRYAALLLAACSSSKPRAADDASHVARAPEVVIDAAAIDAAAVDAYAAAKQPAPLSTDKTGDLQIRVEWKDVPIPMRASPGRTPCKTPRTPVVAPTTTWGIPDVFVIVDGATLSQKPARILFADCTFTPRAVAGSAIVESGVDRPAKITLAKRGSLDKLDKLGAGSPMAIQLPIIGHTVALPTEAGGIYELAADAESAWVIAAPSVGVTEPNGQLLVKDLAPGKYAVTAWLPPRSGAAAKIAKGTATVAAGDLEDVTLTLE
jgi:hypothetical protein